MAYLLEVEGPKAGQQTEIKAPKSVLGRHPHCDVVIDVGAVSRHHAQIQRVGETWFIEDLNSRNGTFLNDHRLRGRERLKQGDVVRVCDVAYEFVGDIQAAPKTTTPAFAAGGGLHTGDGRLHSTDGEGSQFGAVFVDDVQDTSNSTVMSKLDVSSTGGSVHLSVSPEAKLSALLEITQRLGKALSLDEVLPQVLDSLFKIFMQADRGFIVMKDEAGRLIPRWTKVRRPNDEDTIRISRTIVNRVMAQKEAILSADATADSRFNMSESISDLQVRSMICCPLVDSDGNAFGALQIDTLDQRHRFQQHDLEVLVSVATQASISIDNAQLHENALRQQAMERDMELAREVQHGFLPKSHPKLAEFNFFNYYQPASSGGGDYFDYIAMPDGRVAVIVADVTGHGVAAALLMAKLSAEMRFSLASQLRPASALSQLNNTFGRDMLEDRFVTLVMLVLNPDTHDITIVNAGHMAPMLRRTDGEIDEPGEDIVGLPLGVIDDYDYDQVTIKLSPGELLALYTDGINEAMDAAGNQYGIDRMRAKVKETAENALTMGENIIGDVRRFIGDLDQNDDMCLVCVGRAWVPDEIDQSPVDSQKASATAVY